jgi:hypothetical protein
MLSFFFLIFWGTKISEQELSFDHNNELGTDLISELFPFHNFFNQKFSAQDIKMFSGNFRTHPEKKLHHIFL